MIVSRRVIESDLTGLHFDRRIDEDVIDHARPALPFLLLGQTGHMERRAPRPIEGVGPAKERRGTGVSWLAAVHGHMRRLKPLLHLQHRRIVRLGVEIAANHALLRQPFDQTLCLVQSCPIVQRMPVGMRRRHVPGRPFVLDDHAQRHPILMPQREFVMLPHWQAAQNRQRVTPPALACLGAQEHLVTAQFV